jgi:hypothetical protein
MKEPLCGMERPAGDAGSARSNAVAGGGLGMPGGVRVTESTKACESSRARTCARAWWVAAWLLRGVWATASRASKESVEKDRTRPLVERMVGFVGGRAESG